ncbi:DUF397 domain-containing protein [Streptomyces sp. NPDC059080]|uniref:DUF397 domain-containing protein n=1 Tax=Streptomyces sp. NPDC059080 TaxID=3346718 RepID=UPI003694979A
MSTNPQHNLAGADWQKSSYSGSEGGLCVEVARNLVPGLGVLPVRDSKDLNGPVLAFPVASWTSFVEFAKGSEI